MLTILSDTFKGDWREARIRVSGLKSSEANQNIKIGLILYLNVLVPLPLPANTLYIDIIYMHMYMYISMYLKPPKIMKVQKLHGQAEKPSVRKTGSNGAQALLNE